uniref:uncharacterized protein LOC120337216 n=1 Tax=Styela clava TaxID=7725 RepID=UPI0019397FDD|nr:uncharacterized protein LOC120337216 [Styela clava]
MEYFDVSGSETSFDTVTLLSTSLPIQSQKRKKRRRRHRSDDTDFLLLQPAESILLPVTHLINISHHVNNEKENSQIQERHCTIIDGYRFYQYRNSSVLQGCLKDSSMKCQEQHPNFSAILAKHGISYDMSPNGKSTKDHGGSVCRDAADRLLDAMDEQLHDVLLANVGIEDVNDDPGVDPDSVRSLRNRVMYDLAAAEQKKPAFEVKVEIDNEPVPRKQDEASDNNKRTTSYRSSSASRYGQRSTDIGISNDGFHNPTQKPLASSLDRLEQHSTDRNQSASLSARNTSDSRKGRDYERSRDRRRLNDTVSSWDTPSKLSLRDLDSPYTLRSRFYRSMDDSPSKQENPYSPISTMSSIPRESSYSPNRREKFMNRTFDYYHYKPLSTRWHSTPMDLNTKEYAGFTPKQPKRKCEDRNERRWKKIEYKDDVQPFSTRAHHSHPNFGEESYLQSDVEKSEFHVNPLLNTPEKQEEYEWRMKNMLKELHKTPIKPEESFPVTMSSADHKNKSNARIHDQKKSKPNKSNPNHSEDILKNEKSTKGKVPSAYSQNEDDKVLYDNKKVSDQLSISDTYAKTDYHGVPEFAALGTNDSKTSTSIATDSLQSTDEKIESVNNNRNEESASETITEESNNNQLFFTSKDQSSDEKTCTIPEPLGKNIPANSNTSKSDDNISAQQKSEVDNQSCSSKSSRVIAPNEFGRKAYSYGTLSSSSIQTPSEDILEHESISGNSQELSSKNSTLKNVASASASSCNTDNLLDEASKMKTEKDIAGMPISSHSSEEAVIEDRSHSSNTHTSVQNELSPSHSSDKLREHNEANVPDNNITSVSSSSCGTENLIQFHSKDKEMVLVSASSSSCATETLLTAPQSLDEIKAHGSTLSSASTESLLLKKCPSSTESEIMGENNFVEDDISSIHSDNTLTGDKESDSLDTNDVPNVLRNSLVRCSSDERSSLEFTLHVSSTDLESLPTSDFEANWLKRQKTRFPELLPPDNKSADDSGIKSDPFASLSPRSKKKLTRRERMKIALAASQKRTYLFQGDNTILSTPKRRYSWGSDSLRSITTDELLLAKSDGSNFNEFIGEKYVGGRSNLPRSSSVTSLSTVQTEEYEDRYKQMMVRHLAGVPVTSFDSVTIASDLDSVHTDAVREHFLDSMRKHKDSSIAGDLNKPMQNETIKSQRLRDRYIKLKDREKRDLKLTNSCLFEFICSYVESFFLPIYLIFLVTRTNDSIHTNDSVISQNGVLPSRCRTPSRQSNGSRHHSAEVTSSHHRPSSSSKASSRHSRAHSVGPTNRRERTVEADDTHNQYYTNDVTRDSSKPVSRQSYHRSDSIDSANDRRKITSNALNKLQELDSQIEEIESKKKTSEQELKLMEKTMEGHRINLLKLEEKLRENQAKADDARTELMVLEFKKDQCRKDLDATTKEFNTMQDKVKETEDLGMSYDDIVALMQERDDLRARFRRGEASRTSITERQELERALHTAKEDLFRERKLTRERVEELEEKMEDVNHNFEIMESEKSNEISRLQSVIEEMKKTEAVDRNSPYKADRVDAIEAEKRNLFEKVDELNKLLQQKNNEIVSLATETNRSREENRKLQEKIPELESKMSEQIELREKLISETERNTNALKKDKEHAIAAGKQEKEHEIQRILEELEKEKSRAVLEYKSEHQEEICRLRSVLENKDKEIEQLRGRLNHEDDAKRALGEKLRMDAKEQVRSVLAKERLSWEQEKQIADKREDDLRRADFEKERTHLNSEVEEARNKCKIATEQISRLRTEIEELRLETRKLLQEKLDAATQAREHERRDQNKKMDQLRAELEEMNQTEIEKQRSKYNKLEEEMRKIKHEKNDALLKCKEANSNSERNERCFTVEVYDECQKIGDLIRGIRTPSQSRNRSSSLASRSGSHLSRSNRPTNAEGAVSQLRALSDDVRATLRDLTTEVETHRRAAQIAQRERDMAATNSGQSRNSTSSSNHLSQQIAELNGHNSEDIRALSKQLSEKDNELRDIQRNMCMWKDTTAQKLAQKFEEELAVQLERKLGRHRLEHKRQIERMEEDLARLASSHGHLGSMHSEYDASSSLIPPISSTPVKVAPANGATGDKGTVKLLRHLQGRVKQLRAENDLLRSNSQIMDYEGFRKSR